MITEQNLINYLQSQFDDFNEDKARYGVDNHIVSKKFDAIIACKEMTETLIGKPVNLGLDGKVTANELPEGVLKKNKYKLTESGKEICNTFIAECEAKKKEILDAGKDTCDETHLPTISDILDDIEYQGLDEDNQYFNGWGVTDHYDADNILSLTYGKDFVLAKPKLKIEKMNPPMAEKFNGKYVTEMTIDEVFSLYNMLRSKGNLSATEAGWFQICKERIIDHGVKIHAFDYDPFKC